MKYAKNYASCINFTSLRHGLDKPIPQFKKLFGRYLNHVEFDFPLEYTKVKFIQRCLSSSYAPKPNTTEYQIYIQELRKMIEIFASNNNVIIVPNVFVVYWGKLK